MRTGHAWLRELPLRARATAWAPALVVGLVAVGLWSVADVTLAQALLYLSYQALFVVGPGVVVYRMLGGSREGRVRQLVFGWSIGYLLEVVAFMATAAIGARSLLSVYPLLVFGLATVARRRHGAAPRDRRRTDVGVPTTPWAWVIAGLCALALAHVAIEYFAPSPLPEHVDRVAYGLDQVWNLSLAAEARHHWPVSDPTAAGTPLFYHLFSSFDVAATSQVTGLGLPLVFFRLYLAPLVVLGCLQLSFAGSIVGRRPSVGPIAAGLVLFVGELNVDPHVGYRFANELSDDVFAISPSFLFGLVFFLPAVIVLYEQCGEKRQRGWRGWTILAMLLVGCAGAKATILPVLVGGLVLTVMWRWLQSHTVDCGALASLGLAGVVYLASSLLEYNGAGSYGLALDPPGAVGQMTSLSHFAREAAVGGALFWTAAIPVGLVGAYGSSLCGLPWAFRRKPGPVPRGHILLLALLLAGLIPYLLLTHFGLSQVFFTEYGVVAAALLSADGLVALWDAHEARRRHRYVGALAVVVLISGFWLFVALWRPASASAYPDADLVLAVTATVALAAGHFAGARPARSLVWTLAAVLTIGAASKVTGVLVPAATRLADHQPLYSQTGNSLTGGLRRGLSWIRDHTSSNAVVAVNNYRDGSLYWDYGWKVPDDYYYSAIAERRVFLEGWVYAQRAFDLGERDVFLGRKVPFPGRLHLNEAVFEHGNAAALRTMARSYGVKYLVVDRVHNRSSAPLEGIARRTFADPDVAIYAVQPRRLPAARFLATRRRLRGHRAASGTTKPSWADRTMSSRG